MRQFYDSPAKKCFQPANDSDDDLLVPFPVHRSQTLIYYSCANVSFPQISIVDDDGRSGSSGRQRCPYFNHPIKINRLVVVC